MVTANYFSLAFSLFLYSADNPADQLVATLNNNRTAHRSSALFANAGLGCIALEYIKAYQGQCDQVDKGMRPPASDFADKFAPDCGIDAKTLASITGRLLLCQSKYVSPDDVFDLLIRDDRSLQILYDKNHTEVGAAVKGTDGGAPYFWSVLFSSGKSNSSFSFADGTPKPDHPGCYSGANDECSAAVGLLRGRSLWLPVMAGVLIVMASVFSL